VPPATSHQPPDDAFDDRHVRCLRDAAASLDEAGRGADVSSVEAMSEADEEPSNPT